MAFVSRESWTSQTEVFLDAYLDLSNLIRLVILLSIVRPWWFRGSRSHSRQGMVRLGIFTSGLRAIISKYSATTLLVLTTLAQLLRPGVLFVGGKFSMVRGAVDPVAVDGKRI
jgi:hypothetical protein